MTNSRFYRFILTVFVVLAACMLPINAYCATDANDDGEIVTLKTSKGDIKILLFNDTPLHRDNFLKLAGEGYYDGVLFHRVIKDFMVQTGDPDSKNAAPDAMLGAGSPPYTIPAEFKFPTHYHHYGALAAARTGDEVNPDKASSGSQFYIVTGKKMSEASLKNVAEQKLWKMRQKYFARLAEPYMNDIKQWTAEKDTANLEALYNRLAKETEESVKFEYTPEMIQAYETIGGTPHLDGEYTVFGRVLEGMGIVEAIQNVDIGKGDRPLEDIRVITVEVPEKYRPQPQCPAPKASKKAVKTSKKSGKRK